MPQVLCLDEATAQAYRSVPQVLKIRIRSASPPACHYITPTATIHSKHRTRGGRWQGKSSYAAVKASDA
jgi:hypothetical protein